jgi:hypothetical protein
MFFDAVLGYAVRSEKAERQGFGRLASVGWEVLDAALRSCHRNCPVRFSNSSGATRRWIEFRRLLQRRFLARQLRRQCRRFPWFHQCPQFLLFKWANRPGDVCIECTNSCSGIQRETREEELFLVPVAQKGAPKICFCGTGPLVCKARSLQWLQLRPAICV